MGKGLGNCDFDGCQSICDGDIQFCEIPDAMRKYLLDRKGKEEEGAIKKELPNLKILGSLNIKSSQYKVLVVDDEEPIRTFIVTLLSKKGHRCVTAMDGAEALDKMNSDRFDAVITDIVIGKVDGLTLTKEILRRYPGLPIMIMTGYTDDYSVEEAIEAGAQEFIKKPFSITEFDLRFRKMMRDNEILKQSESKKNEMILNLQKESM
jgi:CheY-like chemotaxis protein